MHLQRRVKVQFIVFAIIAILATSVLSFGYGGLGAAFGAGRYTVRVELAEAAGLYGRANVSYRGTTVGRVQDVRLTDTGIEAVLSLQSQYRVPAGVSADVHSQTAIGEQYVDLVPQADTTGSLREGDVIPITRTSVPPDINEQLDMTSTALEAVPKDNLKTLIDESYNAFSGLGPDLGRLIDGATRVVDESHKSLIDLTNLLDNSAPLLNSQVNTSDEIGAWAANLANATQQLQNQDPAASRLLHNAGPVADNARALFERVRPTVPVLMANLAAFADIGVVYNPNLEQTLVLLPQAMAQNIAVGVTNMHNAGLKGGLQQAVLNLNLPPPCLTGFLPPSQRRSPVFEDHPDPPQGDIYCRVPQDSPWNVRGARNIPCENNPKMRAPLVWMCETGTPYVPLNDGNNWKGDPNATWTGQDVPQLPPGVPRPADPPPTPVPPRDGSPPPGDGTPPASAPPALLGVADYNPMDGTYLGPDGQVYTQGNLAANAKPPTLRSLLFPSPDN